MASIPQLEKRTDIVTVARSVVVILNPAAGRGQGARRKAELELALDQASEDQTGDWRIVETSAPGQGSKLAAAAAAGGATIVAAAGGDGTYGEVLNGIIGTGAKLGIIPLGTGNDFSRNLGIGTDIELAVQTILHGIAKPVDVGTVNGRRFINVAGCGFDAVVADRVNRGFRHLHGSAAYVAAILQCLLQFKPAMFHIVADDRAIDTQAMLCTIANSRSYGGGMLIAPDARIDDGLFDLCILAKAGRIEFLRAFPRVFKGTHTTHPKVTMLQARTVLIESDPPMPVLVDGEVIGKTPAKFTIEPSAIQVMAPR
jgi:diacylglycerol kinase (ATP)